MKRRLFCLPGDFVLLAFGVFGALLCPLTALDLPCDWTLLLPAAALFCLVFAALCQLRRVWPFQLAALMGIAAYGYHNRVLLWQTARQLASAALNCWRPTYSWLGFFSWELGGTPDTAAATALWILLAALLTCLLSGAALRRRSLYCALPVTLPLLLVSLAAETASPSPYAVFLLLAFWLGLSLTRDVRVQRDLRSQLAALLLPCGALCAFALLYLLCNPADYTRPAYADEAQLRIIQAMVEADAVDFSTPLPASQQLTDVELDQADSTQRDTTVILRVRASQAGTLYLRGYSLQNYGDNTWSLASGEDEYETYFSALTAGQASQSVEIRSVTDTSGLLYTVYGLCGTLPSGANLLGDYAVAYGGSSYTLSYGALQTGLSETAYAQAVSASDAYLTVDMTAEQLSALTEISQQILQTLPDGASGVDAIAQAVADYVRSSGVYNLDAPANPAGTDFVLYFLQESHEGYCTHFASATTLLLRNLGIPARYVVGYAVGVSEANRWVSVSGADSHAWAEYFDGSAWVPLESTPGYSGISDLTQTEPSPELTQEPTDTQEPATPSASASPEVSPELSPETSTTAEPTQTEPTQSSSSVAGGNVRKASGSLSPAWLLLVPPLLCAAVLLRRRALLSRRQKRFLDSDPAKAFAALWTSWLRLERLGVPEDTALTKLAEKARFSREGAKREDCKTLHAALRTASASLYQSASRPRRLLLRYWYVIS